MRDSRILVVGGAGFIGRHLVSRLLTEGATVDVIARPLTSPWALSGLSGRLTMHRIDIANGNALEAAVRQAAPDIVFHLASGDSRSPRPRLDDARKALANYAGLLIDTLTALAEIPRPPRVVVRAASLAEYGPIETPYHEDQREQPADSHSAGCLAGTLFARMLSPRLPFALTSGRLALVYGPGQDERFLIPLMIRQLLAGRPVHVARPNDRRDLMHIDDAVDGLIALANRPFAPVVNLCTGIAPTMAEVARLIQRQCDASPSLVTFGQDEAVGGTPLLLGSPDLARSGCGWEAHVAIADGIARTVEAERRVLQKELADAG